MFIFLLFPKTVTDKELIEYDMEGNTMFLVTGDCDILATLVFSSSVYINLCQR